MQEQKYYEPMCEYLKTRMNDYLSNLGDFIVDFIPCGTRDLAYGFKEIADKNEISIVNIKSELMRGLYIDILGLVYSNNIAKLIICEVKNDTLTLTHYAQLMGYCIASNTEYGILVGIEKRITGGFESILKQNKSLLEIKREEIVHKFSICFWKPSMNDLIFNEIGAFKSLYRLSRDIAYSLDKIT